MKAFASRPVDVHLHTRKALASRSTLSRCIAQLLFLSHLALHTKEARLVPDQNNSQYGDVIYAWAGHVTTLPSESAHVCVSNAAKNGGGAHLLPVAVFPRKNNVIHRLSRER